MKLDQVIAERKVKTVYRDGDKCIKVFNENYKKYDILNEALNHARIEETGIHIPELFEVTTIDGKWAIAKKRWNIWNSSLIFSFLYNPSPALC